MARSGSWILPLIAIIGIVGGVVAALSWSQPKAKLYTAVCVVGDVRARQMAYVSPGLSQRYLDARSMRYGIGTAAIGTWDSLGDAIAIGGRLWLRSTNAQSPRFFDIVTNPFFLTNNFTYVAATAPAPAQRTFGAIPFTQLWRELAADYNSGVLVAGYVQFKRLDTIALTRPPFKALPVTTHPQVYYTRPMETTENVWAYIVGVSGDGTRVERDRLLSRVLPEARTNVRGYAHVLVLRGTPSDNSVPTVEDVVSLGRVVDSSEVIQATLALHRLNRVRDCGN